MEYYKELRRFVGHRPLILPGAVVIIINGNGEILLQERENNFWGLPGGLMDYPALTIFIKILTEMSTSFSLQAISKNYYRCCY